MIFLAGIILVVLSFSKAEFLHEETATQEKSVETNHEINRSPRGFFNPLGNITRLFQNVLKLNNSRQTTYFFVGILVIILGFVAIFFTGFLDEPITFE